MTGGVALNCVANAKILEHTDVERLWVPPCASDTGAPLGSALVALPPDARPPARLRVEARALRQGLRRPGDRQGARRCRLGLPAHAPGPAAAARGAATWPTGRSSAGSRAVSKWGRARSATARSSPTRAGPTCAMCSTPRSRSASRSARSRPRCWWSGRTSIFEIDQPDPFMTLAPRVRAESRAPHPGGRAHRRHRPHTDRRALGQSALLRPDRGVRPPHGRSCPAQHQLQPHRAHRRFAGGCRGLLSAHGDGCAGAWAISTPPTAAGHRRRPCSERAQPARDAHAEVALSAQRHARLGCRAPAALHPLTRTAVEIQKSLNPTATSKAAAHGRTDASPQFPGQDREDLEQAAGTAGVAGVPHLSLEPRRWAEPAHGHLLGRGSHVRAHGAGCADQDQKRDRPHPHLPPVVPRGHLRVVLDEHRRHQLRSPASRASTT